MRKLRQIIKIEDAMGGYMETPGSPAEILALDDNGELWFGKLESTEDDKRVIDWSYVNRPEDGATFSGPQMDFFDRWEREARARLQADTDSSGEAVPLETEEQDDTGRTGETVQAAPDDNLEDGEVVDPGLGSRHGNSY